MWPVAGLAELDVSVTNIPFKQNDPVAFIHRQIPADVDRVRNAVVQRHRDAHRFSKGWDPDA